MYGYLENVYEVFLEFQEKEISKKAGRRLAKLLKLPIKRKSHVFRVLIEASAGLEDNRTKIKWANALRYAYGWLQPANRLEWFFGVNGGLAGSAAKFAFLQKKRREQKLKEQSLSGGASGLSGPSPRLEGDKAYVDYSAEVAGKVSN